MHMRDTKTHAYKITRADTIILFNYVTCQYINTLGNQKIRDHLGGGAGIQAIDTNDSFLGDALECAGFL